MPPLLTPHRPSQHGPSLVAKALRLKGPETVVSKDFERHCRHRPLNPFDVQQSVIDKDTHILGVRDIKLHQQVIFAGCGIQFRMDFTQRDFLGNAVGFAGAAADLDKDASAHQSLICFAQS